VITTGSNNRIIEVSCQHIYDEMHHYGEDGLHYCPTGFASCRKCGEIVTLSNPHCELWGKK
jgi:hypothetical protein